MGVRCSICAHRERAAIDLALARSVSAHAIGKRYRVSIHSVYRHSKAHLPPQLRASLLAGPAIEGLDLTKLREDESQSLLAHLISVRHRLFAALDTAEDCGDAGMIARVAKGIHENLELVARLLGDLGGAGTSVTNNITLSQTYVEARVVLVRALEPYPEARIAVAQALRQIETKAAAEIAAAPKELSHAPLWGSAR